MDSLRPFGVRLTASRPASFTSLDPDWLRQLTRSHKIVALRGFERLSKDDFIVAARRFGDLLEWNFGYVLDVIVHQEPQNYIFTKGNTPYHWDGAFAKQVPEFLLFQCLEAPDCEGGETTFCDTATALKNASSSELSLWRSTEITYRTDKKAHYGGEKRQTLVDRHPVTGEAILRFAEPLNEDSVDLNPLHLEIRQNGKTLSSDEAKKFLDGLILHLYADEVLYAHRWRDGDFLLADNHALLHGRRSFFDSSRRHLQRIHIL
jgi:alpha-ketoglutarate-dependent taurine dioxygenase